MIIITKNPERMNNIKERFPSLSNDFLTVLETESNVANFSRGEIIMQAGSYIRNTVLVLKGLLKIYREDDEGNEFFLYYLQPGQACAISMICASKQEKSEITAKVIEDTELLTIPFGKIEKWMQEFPTWNQFVLDTYRSRFEEVLQVVDSIAFHSMDERLEFYLKRHFEQCDCMDLEITHQTIASELSTSREVISRLLKKMEQRGMIRLHRNYIQLLDGFITQ